MVKLMERKYINRNGLIERTRFYVADNVRPRGKKKAKSSERKEEQNRQSRVRTLARILNCNASKDKGSLLITLTYDDEGIERLLNEMPEQDRETLREIMRKHGAVGDWKTVKTADGRTEDRPELPEEVQQALYQLRRAAKKHVQVWKRKLSRMAGIDAVKMVAVPSHMDGMTGEMVRIHVHVVMFCPDGLTQDAISKAWGRGDVDFQTLRRQKDYTPLAAYIMAQCVCVKGEPNYMTSRGLEMPEIQERIVLGAAAMRIPAGAKVLEHREPAEGQAVEYARYYMPERSKRIKRNGTMSGGDDDGI